MEALANQMHGLEDEARQSVQGVLPSSHIVSSPAKASPGNNSSQLATALDVLKTEEVVSKPPVPPHENSKEDESEEDDDDKFFDAPEMSPEDWGGAKDTPDSSFPVGHRRSVSTTSVNDASSIESVVSGSDVKEMLPQVSERRMAVSWTPFSALPRAICCLSACVRRFQLDLLQAFLKVHLCQP